MSHNSAFSDTYSSSTFKNSSLLLILGNRIKLLNITMLSLFITTTRHDNYRYKPNSETFVIIITNFPFPCKSQRAYYQTLGKIVILITISTYSSLKSNFTKLQTLSSFIKREKLCNFDYKVRTMTVNRRVTDS